MVCRRRGLGEDPDVVAGVEVVGGQEATAVCHGSVVGGRRAELERRGRGFGQGSVLAPRVVG
jgi:hypothetical protein